MNRILYEIRCKCNEEISLIKRRRLTKRSEGKALFYPDYKEFTSKIFQIKYEHPLSSTAKLLLNNFQNKYLYYAIDDILYSLEPNSNEREQLLAFLYSPVLSLQNNFSIDFFDIWIQEIYVEEMGEMNNFLIMNDPNFQPFNYLTIKFLYRTKVPIKRPESLW